MPSLQTDAGVTGTPAPQAAMGGEPDKQEPMAVVAMACRFPGEATSVNNFWEMLLKGRGAHSDVPGDRFRVENFHHPNNFRSGTMTTRTGHFLEQDIAAFDAPFFSMSAPEATATDPQLRMMLEVAFECFESGGIPLEQLVGSKTSCFVGSSSADYNAVAAKDIDDIPMYQAIGGGNAMLSNRISHFFDLRGHSMTLDTACSSGLIALHLGCQSIRTGESRASVVAASQLMLLPDMFTSLANLHFLSPDGRCFTFDERANGYSRGEGTAVMVIKSLADAIADGDTIRAVIRGTGTNQDGKTPGIVQPSSDAQAALIRSTYETAGLDFNKTQLFEAHGTGTPVGDPLELSAVAATLGTGQRDGQPLYVGSVKTNVGHLEGCAGLAGLIKSILCLENGVIVPSINYEKPNPRLRLDEWGLKVPTKAIPWPVHGLRRASINSFGYGGSNAHCIVDDAYNYMKLRGIKGNTKSVPVSVITPSSSSDDEVDSGRGTMTSSPTNQVGYFPPTTGLRPRLFVWSALEQQAMQNMVKAFSDYITNKSVREPLEADNFLAELAYTLSNRRTVFPWRASFVASSKPDLASALGDKIKGHRATKSPKTAFIFTGQGAQWPAMGQELMAYDVFANTVRAADKYLSSIGADWSVMAELAALDKDSQISLAKFSQPLCCVLQTALVDLLNHWGVKPNVVIGHSSGEIGAAYATGALSAEDCWKVAFHRGRLSEDIKTIAPHLKGSMLAVGLSETEVKPYLEKLGADKTAVVACVNSPSNVTVSGDITAIDVLIELLKPDDVFARKLKVENAYHSPHMQTIAADYLEAIKDIQPRKPNKDAPIMISSVTGAQIAGADLDASYWVRNMVSPVQFVKAVGVICVASATGVRRRRKDGLSVDTLLEVGPHAALQGPLKQILAEAKRADDTTYLSMLSRGQDAAVTALETSGKLWSLGQPLDFLRVNSYEADPKPSLALPDMPGYAWNHTHTFWHETTLSGNHRFRQTPRLDILGKRVDDFNPLEAKWTNTIRKTEIPWVKDHVIQGDILFPAAGMISAVLEAAQQLAEENKPVRSFELRDINFSRAFVLPSDDTKVTMTLTMKPRKLGIKGSEKPWTEFTVYAQLGEEPMAEQCCGLVMTHYERETEDAEEAAEKEAEWKAVKDEYAKALKACEKPIEPKDFYAKWNARGLEYGPQFQPISKIQTNETDTGLCTVVVQDTQANMPAQFEYSHLLHPVTLDGMFQTVFTAISGNESPAVPRSIDTLIVSAHLPSGPGAEFLGNTHTVRRGFRDLDSSHIWSDSQWSEPKVTIRGAHLTELGGLADDGAANKTSSAIRKMCGELIWKEDVDHVRQAEAEQLFKPAEDANAEHIAACNNAVTIYMRRAIDRLTPEREATLAPHEVKYVQWMRSGLAATGASEATPEQDDAILDGLAEMGVEARLIQDVGQNLGGILDGTVAPLPLMTKDNALFDFYVSHPTTSMVTKWMDLQGHKRPDYKVLEIGAGTGAMALPILETLGGRHGATARVAEYVFTDSDSACLESAQSLLKDWQSHITFKKLDIDRDPLEQDFKEKSFDVIVAGHMLHGTRSIGTALQYCHKLLRPGGRLVITDYTRAVDRIGFVLGALPNWWLHEDGREGGQLIDEDQWGRHLEASGFSGLDIIVKDTQDRSAHCSSMMVSTKRKDIDIPFEKMVIVDAVSKSEAANVLAASVTKLIGDMGIEVVRADLESAVAVDSSTGKSLVSGTHVLSLVEAEKPLLADISETDFAHLKHLLLQSEGGLWVSRAGRQVDPAGDPAFDAISGLLRVTRQEKPDIRMLEMNFSTGMDLGTDAAADLVYRVTRSLCNDDLLQLESEFCERDGRLFVPRIFDEMHKNHSLQTLGMRPTPERQPFSQPNRPLKLDIGTPGMLDSLHFVDDPSALEPLAENDIEIEVLANSVNFLDVMVSMGLIADTEIGLDAAGVVKRAGSKVSLVQPGDRVATFCMGAYRNLLRTHETLVQKIPENLSIEEAASLPCAFITAVQGLIEIGRLQPGESVLIHSATGGLGQAAVQVAKHIGAEIFATAGSMKKRQILTEDHGIPADHVFNSRDVNFARGVLRMTGGRGVDVVLNSLAGEALRKTWECTAMFGRFVEVGKRDILANTGLEMIPFLRNVTFSCVNVEHMARHNKPLLAKVWAQAMGLVREGSVGLVKPITVYHYSEMESAFRNMQQARHTGKLVLKAEANDLVPVIPRNPHPLTFNDGATYVLIGGLGGIGRALATFMAEKGAKNLAFLSRSGDSKAEAKEALQDLRAMGVNAIAYACDVTNAGDLRTTYANMAAEMPHIKGVIQAAMVLNDYYFEEMTYQQWIGTTRPKIQGSWNLHDIMPKDLDFFVMLSSISGISGNGAQSNYAAGNTYQDALAHYRHAQSLTACALDLGAISGVGWMAENMQIAEEFKGDFERMSLKPRELYSLLESAMTGFSEGEHRLPTQLVTGMGSGGIGQQMEHLKTSSAFDDPKYTFLRRLDVKGVVQTTEDSMAEVKTALSSTANLTHAAELVEGALALKLATSLSMAVDDIDTHKAVFSYGVDSLVAIEIRNWIFKELRSQVSVFDILAKLPMTQLALKIAAKSGHVPAALRGEGEAAAKDGDAKEEEGAKEELVMH